MTTTVAQETLVENVYFCRECDGYFSDSEIVCEHELEESEFFDIC